MRQLIPSRPGWHACDPRRGEAGGGGVRGGLAAILQLQEGRTSPDEG
jgi:hypothetical protein